MADFKNCWPAVVPNLVMYVTYPAPTLQVVVARMWPVAAVGWWQACKALALSPWALHREPSHPFRIWVKDQNYLYHACCVFCGRHPPRGRLRGLLVRGLERDYGTRSEPARRSNKVTLSLYYFRWVIGSSEKFASLRLPLSRFQTSH